MTHQFFPKFILLVSCFICNYAFSQCNHTISFTDTYGDGWNGTTVTIDVNGTPVPGMINITLAAGFGPQNQVVSVNTGDVITVTETSTGAWPGEEMIEITSSVTGSLTGPSWTQTTPSATADCGGPMTVDSYNVFQASTANAEISQTDVELIGVEIVTSGSLTPLSLTDLEFNLNGSSSIADFNGNMKVYYTGTSATFNNSSLFASSPLAGAIGTWVTLSGAQVLSTGSNYFWLATDINSGATIGNVVDGRCRTAIVGGVDEITTVENPGGSRLIVAESPKPGGVYDATIWFDANYGAETGGAAATNGSAVDLWPNKMATPGVVNVVQGTLAKRPTFNTNPFNYNPTFYFDGTDDRLDNTFLASDFMNTTDNTVAIVHRYYGGVVIWKFFRNGDGSGRMQYEANGANYRFDYNGTNTVATTYTNEIDIFSTRTNHSGNLVMNENGSVILTNAAPGAFDITESKEFYFGENPQAAWPLNARMDLAEFVIFPKDLNDTEQRQLDSYLALKYAVTLDNTGGGVNGDYLSTSATTIWDASAGLGYHNDVIGIGRDDSQAFYQKQSHTQDDVSRMYVAALSASNNANVGTFSSDESYVVAGQNLGAMCATAASIAEMPAGCGLYSRLEREWRLERTNMTDLFAMDFTLSACAVPGSVNIADLRLLVDDDGDFSNGGTSCFFNGDGTGINISYAGSVITIANLSTTHIANNSARFITIGSNNPATPLPVELVLFEVNCDDQQKAILNWSTASENNSDYFTIERSIDQSNFEIIGELEASEFSNEMIEYEFIDYNFNRTGSYYRLSQTDNDGKKEYLGERYLDCEMENRIEVYPNPFMNQVTIVSEQEAQVQLFDLAGVIILDANISAGENLLPLVNIDAASYILKITMENGEFEIIKLVKMK